MSEKLIELFGENVINQERKEVAVSSLKDKYIGIYFSAHWCPPCKMFTPMLVKFYNDMQKAGKPFEIIFASSDRNEEAFNGYYGEMPWLAIPFGDKRKESLSVKYKVQGIPTFVLLDSEGNTITTKARNNVMQDPEGKDFPWTPKPYKEIIGDSVLDSDGNGVSVEEKLLSKEVVGYYFGAKWCGPCQRMLEPLTAFYENLQKQGKDFELCFCSLDKTEEDFLVELKAVPGLAFPFKDSRITQLQQRFEIQSLPTIVLVDNKGDVIYGGKSK